MPPTLELFLTFFKVGCIGYGTGVAMLSLIQEEAVVQHHWLQAHEVVEGLALLQAFPGPISTKFSVYVGYKVAGWGGAGSALLGLVLPSSALVCMGFSLFIRFKEHPLLQQILWGIRPVALAMIGDMLFKLSRTEVGGWGPLFLFLGALIFLSVSPFHPGWIFILGGVAGVCRFLVQNR